MTNHTNRYEPERTRAARRAVFTEGENSEDSQHGMDKKQFIQAKFGLSLIQT